MWKGRRNHTLCNLKGEGKSLKVGIAGTVPTNAKKKHMAEKKIGVDTGARRDSELPIKIGHWGTRQQQPERESPLEWLRSAVNGIQVALQKGKKLGGLTEPGGGLRRSESPSCFPTGGSSEKRGGGVGLVTVR